MAKKSHTYYMELALRTAQESPDPYMKVGCVAVAHNGKVTGFGFNDILDAKPNDEFWKDRDARRKYMVHAEVNLAKLFTTPLDGSEFAIDIIYITLLPCVHCMTVLASLKVRKLYYLQAYEKDSDAFKVADFYGIIVKKYGDA